MVKTTLSWWYSFIHSFIETGLLICFELLFEEQSYIKEAVGFGVSIITIRHNLSSYVWHAWVTRSIFLKFFFLFYRECLPYRFTWFYSLILCCTVMFYSYFFIWYLSFLVDSFSVPLRRRFLVILAYTALQLFNTCVRPTTKSMTKSVSMKLACRSQLCDYFNDFVIS